MSCPKKEDGKSRPETAKFLEDDFRKALKKGYSPKELSLLLKNAGIMIPAYLIQNYLPETADAPPAPKRDKTPAQKQENAPAKTPAPAGNTLPDWQDERSGWKRRESVPPCRKL